MLSYWQDCICDEIFALSKGNFKNDKLREITFEILNPCKLQNFHIAASDMKTENERKYLHSCHSLAAAHDAILFAGGSSPKLQEHMFTQYNTVYLEVQGAV